MKILIINPNSDPKMTSVILSAAESFAGDTLSEGFDHVYKSYGQKENKRVNGSTIYDKSSN